MWTTLVGLSSTSASKIVITARTFSAPSRHTYIPARTRTMPSARGAPGSATTAAADALGLLACSVTTDTGRQRGPGVLALVGGIVLPYVLAVACPRLLCGAAGLLDSALALLVLAALGARPKYAERPAIYRLPRGSSPSSCKAPLAKEKVVGRRAETSIRVPMASALREELQGVRVMELHARAAVQGVGEALLEDAMDSAEPRATPIQVIN